MLWAIWRIRKALFSLTELSPPVQIAHGQLSAALTGQESIGAKLAGWGAGFSSCGSVRAPRTNRHSKNYRSKENGEV